MHSQILDWSIQLIIILKLFTFKSWGDEVEIFSIFLGSVENFKLKKTNFLKELKHCTSNGRGENGTI